MQKNVAGDARTCVTVVLPVALMRLFPDCQHEVLLEASTVKEMIEELNGRWPGMRDRLCDSTPRIRRHLNIFVEGQRATLETSLSAGMCVTVLTSMSGG